MRIRLCECMRDLAMLAKAFGGELSEGDLQTAPYGLTTDTEELLPGDVFLALRGSKHAGWEFAERAAVLGAGGVILPRGLAGSTGDCAKIEVEDTMAALLAAAAARRKQLKGRVIAISGSAGKTTLKEGLAAVLSEIGSVAYSEGNYNSTVGMPMSLLGMEDSDHHILELGINHVGEMEPMSRAVAPELAVLTNVGSAHIGHFQDFGEILCEKCKISLGLREGGVLFLPSSLELAHIYCEKNRIFLVGSGMDCTIRAENIHMDANGVVMDVTDGAKRYDSITWPVPGRIGAAFLSMCGAVSLYLGVSQEKFKSGLAHAAQISPRMCRVLLKKRLLLKDAYNASPESMAGALETLRLLAGGRQSIAVLGDMAELGDHARALHEAVGECVAKHRISYLVTYGEAALGYAAGALLGGMPEEQIFSFFVGEENDLVNAVLRIASKDARILVKGARRMRMERITEWMERRAQCKE